MDLYLDHFELKIVLWATFMIVLNKSLVHTLHLRQTSRFYGNKWWCLHLMSALDGKDQRKKEMQTLSIHKAVEDNENGFRNGYLLITLLVTLPGNTYLWPRYRCWGGCHTHLWPQYRCWGGCHRSLFLPLPSRPQHSRHCPSASLLSL